MRISLLPGWGLGLSPLQPLAAELAQKLEVELVPLPECISLEQALDELDTQIAPDSWLAGWSLGGMLATALASRRGTECPGLITLASNASFITRQDWPHAMPESEYRAFFRRAVRDLSGTLKRFELLCRQGEEPAAAKTKQGYKSTVQLAAQGNTELFDESSALLAPLAWLREDNRDAIRALQCPQLHVLAEQDALVPVAVADDLRGLNTKAQVQQVTGSHAFVQTRHQEVAALMQAFIKEHESHV